jgi:hypothetical protein
MTTTRHLERTWNAGSYARLLQELCTGRPEDCPAVRKGLQPMLAAAAMIVIRLDELSQSHHPLARVAIQAILARQGSDGGWSDPMTTALCVRALACSQGDGVAIERGIGYLARLQKDDGLWPSEPLRRLPSDPLASAFILLQLGQDERFRNAVRFDEAIAWFDSADQHLDDDTVRTWQHAHRHCARRPIPAAEAYLWS